LNESIGLLLCLSSIPLRLRCKKFLPERVFFLRRAFTQSTWQTQQFVTSPEARPVNAARRSHLIHIALLCVAVLFSHTARATTSVDAIHHCALRSSVKVVAEAPASKKKFALKTKKTAPRPQSTFALGACDQLLSPHTALMLTSHQAHQALLFAQTLYTASSSRLFVLRI